MHLARSGRIGSNQIQPDLILATRVNNSPNACLLLTCISLKTQTKGAFRTAFAMEWPEGWSWRIEHRCAPNHGSRLNIPKRGMST